MTARDRGHVEEIINHLKRVENDYRINLTEEMEWLRGLTIEEQVSEDLEKEIQDYYNSRREYSGKYNAVIPVYKHQLIDIARHFTNWQKQQDDKMLNEKQWEAWGKGGEEMRQELIKGAKSGVVSEEGDFIEFEDGTAIDLDPSMQLNPAFVHMSGDKVKVIIIKE